MYYLINCTNKIYLGGYRTESYLAALLYWLRLVDDGTSFVVPAVATFLLAM
jgi:hypothetical protein